MEFIKEPNRIYANNGEGRLVAEVTFPEKTPGDPGIVEITHTFVDDSLRGQGVAGQLMEECYGMLKNDGRKAALTCSYAVKWYQERPEKNDIIDVDEKDEDEV